MIARVSRVRELLERGWGMRAQRVTEGLLLAASFMFDDLRPAYAAAAMLAMQAFAPRAVPVALAWLLFDRRVPPDRLGNLYYDANGVRGAAAISCLVLGAAFALIRWTTFSSIGRVLIAAPAASCILSATVGFCAGCGYYVIGRDLLVRAGVLGGAPEGACDVDIEGA
jgi:hypothetical protein